MRDGTRPAATDPQPVGIEARSGDAAARVSDTTVLAAEAQPGSSGNTSSGGGEQAGRADAGHEAGALTAGELRLRITQRDTPLDAAGRQSAGSGAAGTYQDAGASGSQAPGGPLRAAAAARLPAGSRAWVRGPAQTELVNRYFEERGRQP